MGVLDQAIDAALTFKPLEPEAVTALLERTRDAASEGRLREVQDEPRSSTGRSTTPKWLTTAEV